MCDEKSCCQQPEQLQGFPRECTPEQIRICHGDVPGHPCVQDTQQGDKAAASVKK